MTKNKQYHVAVPATTANIGSGFDVLGLSLALYNEAVFTVEEGLSFSDLTITAEGEGTDEMAYGPDNIVCQAMKRTAETIGKPLPGGHLHLINRIPFARGMGSSSAAIVAGVGLANLYFGEPLSKKEMLSIAADMEGHPDNAAPAVLGGFVISMMDEQGVRGETIPVSPEWQAVVAVPDFELLTKEARAVLPDSYSRKDAVHNIGAVSFLLAAFFQKKPEYLRIGLQDRIHVPYRLTLIPGGQEVVEQAEKAGAYGATISGSGSTMIAFTDRIHAEQVGIAMQQGFASAGISSRIMVLDFDRLGVHRLKA